MGIEHVAGPLRESLAGDPWHGPALAALLAGVAPGDASRHPVGGAHSILELVLHLAAWKREAVARLRGGSPGLPAMGDWPAPDGDEATAWAAARRELDEAHAELLRAVGTLPEWRLDERLGQAREAALGTGVTVARLVVGLAEHDAYHGGQIAILKRALAAARSGGA